jgi:Tfp pilus assembly protein PilF
VQAAAGFLAYEESSQCLGACDREGLLDAAESSLEQAIDIDPTLPEARGWLGLVDLRRGNLVRAAEQAEAALELDPLSPVAAYNANTFLLARGQISRARERLMVLVRRPDTPAYVFLQLAQIDMAMNHPEEAVGWIERAVATDARRPTHVQAAAMLAALGHSAQARASLAAHAATRPVDRGETLWLALLAHRLLDGRAGVSAYLEAQVHRRQLNPRPSTADAEREWDEFQGYAAALIGAPAEAIPLLEAAFGAEGAPRIRRSAVQEEAGRANALAWAYRETGNFVRAREIALGAVAALNEVASDGFDQTADFALTRSLACELAGLHDAAAAELLRAQALGIAPGADLRFDPRWDVHIVPGGTHLSERM